MLKNFFIFTFFFAQNITWAQTTGSLPPLKPAQTSNSSVQNKNNQSSSQGQPKQDFPKADLNKPHLFNPSLLINDAWGYFIGRNGIVDEKKAFDYTQIAIKILDEDKDKNSLSIAKNNLSVIYLCSINPLVRDIRMGFNYNQDYNDSFSLDNFIWNVFFNLRSVENPRKFYEIIREGFPNHPVNRYIGILNGVPPKSLDASYKFLAEMAESGDPLAAMRIGFRHECSFEKIDINEAIRWYSASKELHIRNGSSERSIKSVEDRIQRLNLINDGKTIK